MWTPNVFVWLLQVLSWAYWRPPMATETKPKREPRPPRRPRLSFAQFPIPPEVHSIIRTTWYKNGRTVEVDEIQLLEYDDVMDVFHYVVGGALRHGCDVTVMTTYAPADLGVPLE